ncbi:MAG: ClpXP protease specificity-enhancing factor SspB [Pseudomonadota bacterium]
MARRALVELNYGRMMQRAMQGLMAEALGLVAEHGLPGDHHFYITFLTGHPGVDMPDWLRERFPEEMVIVLQHEFQGLSVIDDRFSVTLSFNSRLATLVVPFEAVAQFADPSAEFGLRFDPSESFDETDEEETDLAQIADVAASDQAAPGADQPEDGKAPGEVVSLDEFRKK